MKNLFNIYKKIINNLKKIKYFSKTKIIFKNPKEVEIVIFDRLTGDFIKSFFKGRDCFIIDIPGPDRSIKNIYISLLLLKLLFLEILNKNILTCYYSALIKILNPKIVITHTDNHFDFYKLAKIYDKKIKFVAIQNAYRDMSSLTEIIAKKIFIPNYFCFGKQTVDHFKKIGATVKNFHIVGSLRQHYAEESLKSKNIDNEKKYDICLISENLPRPNDPVRKERFESLMAIAKNVEKLTLEHNLKTVLALKKVSHDKGKDEINFYKNIFKENSPIIFTDRLEKPYSNEDAYSNYETAYKSKIVVGSRSTLLLEAFVKGGRILVCNYKHEYFLKKNKDKNFERFEELNPLLNFDNYFSIYNKDYNVFKQKALDLINMDKDSFENYKKDFNDYMLLFDNKNSTYNKIQEKINTWLK